MVKMINAKEFKDKQGKSNDDVLAGQDVVVTHSTKQPIHITASMQNCIYKKGISGLKAFDRATKRPVKFDNNRPTEDICHEYMKNKYGK